MAGLAWAFALAPSARATGRDLTWDAFQSPPAGSSPADVAARSSTDAWTVGLRSGGSCQFQTLTEHWDGRAWTVVPSRNVPGVNSVLYGVAFVSSSDVWAVGDSSCPGVQDGRTLIEHWNGASWSIVPSPNGGADSVLHAVFAIGANDVWAVGSQTQGNTSVPLIERWNGSVWTVVSAPLGSVGVLLSVDGTSANDVWAVGNDETNGTGPIVLHWDGAAWNEASLPTPGGDAGQVSDVFAISPGNAWIAGGHRPGGGSTLKALTWRWNGTAWAFVRTPDAGQLSSLQSISGAPAAGLWAAGFEVDQISSKAVILHRVGGRWTVATPPDTTFLLGLAVASDGELWTLDQGVIFHGAS